MTSPLRLAPFLLATTAASSAVASDPPELELAAPTFTLDRVLHDEPGDGRLWACGASWKASFAPGATTFYPFFGPDAPRHYPLRLRVAQASLGGEPLAFDASAEPERHGDAIRYDRGRFTEVYETRLDSIEQSFVFDELERSGELVIRVDAETELAARDEAAALVFENELGAVRYSHAVALDARGERVEAPTKRSAGGIEIRVPADFVARARLPLIVDPVIETYSFSTRYRSVGEAALLVDVAYDRTTDSYGYVYEVRSNAEDVDLHYAATASGSSEFVCFEEIDVTSDSWSSPAIANHAALDEHLVVARVVPESSNQNFFYACRVSAGASGAACGVEVSLPIYVDGPYPLTVSAPEVGGVTVEDPALPWAIVYSVTVDEMPPTPDTSIAVATRLFLSGPSSATILGTADGGFLPPSISRADDGAGWNVLWTDDDVLGTADVWGGRLSHGGELQQVIRITDSGASEHGVRASSTRANGTWLAMYDRGSDEPELLCRTVGNGALSIEVSLSHELSVRGLANGSIQPGRSDVDADEGSFVVAYVQERRWDSETRDLCAMTVSTVGITPRVADAHVLSTGTDYHPSIVAHASGGSTSRRFLIAVHEGARITSTSYAADQFVTLCVPDYDAGSCPCPNPSRPDRLRGCENGAGTGGARLEASGVASESGDSMRLSVSDATPNVPCFFVQGNSLGHPSAFGRGLTCVEGTRLLYTGAISASGRVMAPLPGYPSISQRSALLGDPILAGSYRWYFVHYRDVGFPDACPNAASFNTTPAIQTLWAP